MNINKELNYAASYMPPLPRHPQRKPQTQPKQQPKQGLLEQVTALANSIDQRLCTIDTLLT